MSDAPDTAPAPAPWRPAFLAALRLLARVSEAMVARGFARPILVGGGAVEFYSGSAVMTGDLDVTTPRQAELEEELRRIGFTRTGGPGHSLHGGWLHPDLALGFECVADTPMDGNCDPAHLLLIEAAGAEDGSVAIVSIEDLIADRMGQYAAHCNGSDEMREQARQLFGLKIEYDMSYLERRIREETAGDHGIDDIEG